MSRKDDDHKHEDDHKLSQPKPEQKPEPANDPMASPPSGQQPNPPSAPGGDQTGKLPDHDDKGHD